MEQKKPKAAFIDHSFKQKTHSSDFVKELLFQEYNLFDFWDESWCGGPSIKTRELNAGNFKTIFFFQLLPPARIFSKLRCQNFVWFPMYDQEAPAKLFTYLPYLRFKLKIVCFAKVLYRRFQSLGFDCYYIRYFPQVLPRQLTSKEPIVFYWLRTRDVPWTVTKKILGKNKVKAIILKNTPDPGQEMKLPSKEDQKRYNIKIMSQWFSRGKYERVLSLCNVFIAPRKAEGIGLSFLEAMARGMAVIAPDNPTMNEYIKQGETGYLYDLHKPQALDLIDFKKVGEKARASVWQGRKKWLQAPACMLEYLREPHRMPRRGKRFWQRFVYSPAYFIYTIKSSLHL